MIWVTFGWPLARFQGRQLDVLMLRWVHWYCNSRKCTSIREERMKLRKFLLLQELIVLTGGQLRLPGREPWRRRFVKGKQWQHIMGAQGGDVL
jgi:hypothetical protein